MDKVRNFRKIMEKSCSNNVYILTNNYQISGTVCEEYECNKDFFINLKNVTMCKINEAYSNGESVCEEYSSVNYEWLHINLDNVIAFSFIKE